MVKRIILCAVSSFTFGTACSAVVPNAPLEDATQECGFSEGVLDSAGNFSEVDNSAGDYIDPRWSCLVKTLAGQAVLDTLLTSTGMTGPVTVPANGHTFTFSYNGNSERASLTIIKN